MDLLAYMNKFWISQNEPNWILWAHEFSKHATCYSTFQTECYVSYIYKTLFKRELSVIRNPFVSKPT